MRRVLIFLLTILLAVLVAGVYWWKNGQSKPEALAYVGQDGVTVWSSTAQIRQALVTLHYGERVAVLESLGDRVRIRTPEGLAGWLKQDQLIMPELWQRLEALAARARSMPVEARGHTHARSNVHVDPGRAAPVIGQLGGNTPVDILARAVARSDPGEGQPPRPEDWLLVRVNVPRVGELAGWVLGRFITLDLPPPLSEYAAAAAMRVVAWQPLGQVIDPQEGAKPYLLVVGTRGPEGQPCDFTMLLVYTWGIQHKRYETAYVEENLCGMLPVEVAAQTNGDYWFHFTVLAPNGKQVESYRMRATIVSRMLGREPREKSRRRRVGSSPRSGPSRR